MADTPRRRPYVYVTWITKLLSGESSCWWAAWYKSTHKYEKRPDDGFDSVGWNKKHDALTDAREAELIADGWVTRKEDAAEFTLKGAGADLAGKPDLVGLKDGTALVIDAKSGKPKKADHWQVLIYMFALPMSWLKSHTLVGEVVRPDGIREDVRPITAAEREQIIAAVRKVTAKEPPAPDPGPRECRFCDILHCPTRYVKPEGDARGMW